MQINDDLYTAIKYDDLNEARYLLNNGADANLKVGEVKFPIIGIAAFRGNLDMVKLLLKSGANINNISRDGDTPFSLLLSTNADQFQENSSTTPNFIKIVKLLLNQNINLNVLSKITGTSPLITALLIGDVALIEFIIKNGADPNFCDKSGKNTALHIAVELNSFALVLILLDLGANKDLRNNEGKTPLDIAINLKNRLNNSYSSGDINNFFNDHKKITNNSIIELLCPNNKLESISSYAKSEEEQISYKQKIIVEDNVANNLRPKGFPRWKWNKLQND